MNISKFILALSAIFAISTHAQSDNVIYWPNTDTSQYYYESPLAPTPSYNDNPYNEMMQGIQNQQMQDMQREQMYRQQLDRGNTLDQSFYCSWITNNAKLQETCYNQ